MSELESITVENFRTIGAAVTVPLDAPVVLIHGPNGAGKTSILSALELALTGSVASMRRTEANYLSHVVHRGAESSSISISARGEVGRRTRTWALTVLPGEVIGDPMLDSESARFFSERCYLAQSVLGRLLEIYEHGDSNQDSPLTRFVNDLLGLDELDYLIGGLHAVMDVRNMRNLVPKYASAERKTGEYQRTNRETQETLDVLNRELVSARTAISEEFRQLASDANLPLSLDPLDESFLRTQTAADEGQLIALTSWRREVAALLQRAETLGESTDIADIAVLEQKAAAAQVISEQWRSATGRLLEDLVTELREEFPDLPSFASTDPSVALDSALARTRAELTRCGDLLSSDDVALLSAQQLSQTVEQAQSRISLLNEQLANEASNAALLANLLNSLLPHVLGDDCPVCGRDFSEVSEEPLTSRMSQEISRFMEDADRATRLSSARLEAETDLSNAQQRLTVALSRRLAPNSRILLQARVSKLEEWIERLGRLVDDVFAGTSALRAEAEARRDLAAARNRNQNSVELRLAVRDLCTSMSVAQPDELETVIDALRRLGHDIAVSITSVEGRIETRLRALNRQQEIARIQSEIKRIMDERVALNAMSQEVANSLTLANQRRDRMKSISRAASSTRTEIVRQVFNQALNQMWRDLFVRLAPNEPYVPAFRIPDDVQRVTAQLVTTHRSGGNGGSPGAMLSAGNLNTAALTLFLGLHLTAGAQLPWLILDDPVQSMDEIHISQFAALLRTLAKEHGRRLILAVHERQLFEYLALELSPAFQGDRLITVELKKFGHDECVVESSFLHWKQDPVAEVA